MSCFPPSRGDLNEYGFHLASALRQHPGVELVVLADEIEGLQEIDGFKVERCWRFNSLLTPARLLKAIRKTKPHVVWFNMGFSTFARDPLAAFLSVACPAITKWSGFYTHVTLHTLFERINLKDAGVRMPRAYRAAGKIATQVLLGANDLTVLLPSFRSELIRNYKTSEDRVHVRPHGIFSTASCPEMVSNTATVLAFGYWGTYKRLDLLLESWPRISQQLPQAKLMIAGLNHPSTPGYLEGLQARYAEYESIKFLGYVPEQNLPSLFRSASVLVLPYSSAAGTSGVVHQACEYGLPMVAAAIPEIEELAREHNLGIRFYSPGDGTVLTNHLLEILSSDSTRRALARHNLEVASSMQISQVVSGYLDFFKARIVNAGPRIAKEVSTSTSAISARVTLDGQVGEWLLHSGIEDPGGGVARYYLSDEKRNKPVSTEITGYCASAFVALYQQTGDEKYRNAALRQSDFLARKAWDGEIAAMPFECAGENRSYSYFFDVGIIIRGLLAVWRMSRKPELLDAAIRCGDSLAKDFSNGEQFDPIITLPNKNHIAQEPVRWSRSSGCYQLKAALAWWELAEATADQHFMAHYRRLLSSALESHLSFLPGSQDELKVMDRLHAYSYFLEGLLPCISNTECREAMQSGISRLTHYARAIASQFLRSDVLAQLLRVRIFADQAGAVPMDHEAARHEASLIREFQSDDPDPRLKGGFWFGRKAGIMLPYMNPVSTVFCYQALEMWERYQTGERKFDWHGLI
ncbi:MAG TPA: glycosyltransferase [Candidatus Sulfotelmatobacter sp.]|nr:glycosyltransferase [Candidatus Sulfotelmatobacter sp.]